MPDEHTTPQFTTENFDAQLEAAGDKPVFIDFYAEWCGPCKVAAPVVDALSQEFEGRAVVAKVNVDKNNQISSKFGVVSIPTVVILKKNAAGQMEEIDKVVGFPGEEKYRSMLESALK